MGNVTHRPKHKKKLAARKTRIAAEKAQYKKYMTKQIEMIQEQIRAQQAAANNNNSVGSPDIMVPSITPEGALVQQLGDIKTMMEADQHLPDSMTEIDSETQVNEWPHKSADHDPDTLGNDQSPAETTTLSDNGNS